MAAHTNAWNVSTYTAHESGRIGFDVDHAREYARKFRVDLAWLMLGEPADEEQAHVIPVMGRVGAGGDIEPDYEQVPVDGLEQIEMAGPLGLVADPIAFRVVGHSMHPRFKDGELVVVEREQPYPTDAMIGEEAVLLIYNESQAGRRMLKRVMPGPRAHTYTLESLDPAVPPMIGVRIRWASPVRVLLPAATARRAGRRQAPGERRAERRQER